MGVVLIESAALAHTECGSVIWCLTMYVLSMGVLQCFSMSSVCSSTIVCVPIVHASKRIAGSEHCEFFMCLCSVCVLRWSLLSLLLWYMQDGGLAWVSDDAGTGMCMWWICL